MKGDCAEGIGDRVVRGNGIGRLLSKSAREECAVVQPGRAQ